MFKEPQFLVLRFIVKRPIGGLYRVGIPHLLEQGGRVTINVLTSPIMHCCRQYQGWNQGGIIMEMLAIIITHNKDGVSGCYARTLRGYTEECPS